MLWVGALMALVACGGGESLTYDESIDSISSAMARTMAAEFSIERHAASISLRRQTLLRSTPITFTNSVLNLP